VEQKSNGRIFAPIVENIQNQENMKNDFVIYYSNLWLEQAIKDNDCKNEKELYLKTLKNGKRNS
jgi:hypothetical protein